MKKVKTLILAAALLLGASVSMANPEYANANIGTVAETMTSGGYVYVRLEEDGSWLASTPTELRVGDKVRYSSGMVMPNFASPSLDRTFESLRLVERLEVVGAQFDESAHSVAAETNPHEFAKSAVAEAPQAGEITPFEGGKTIAEIVVEPDQLTDQEVSLRAKVMKVNKNILGKNWITLQDGTGAPGSKLLATSTELVEIGTIVVAKGTVKTDVDLGMGYKYEVMLEGVGFSK